MGLSNHKWKCVSACLGGLLGMISVHCITKKTGKQFRSHVQDAILSAPRYIRRMSTHAKNGAIEANTLFRLHARDWKHTTKKIVRQISHECKTWPHKAK